MRPGPGIHGSEPRGRTCHKRSGSTGVRAGLDFGRSAEPDILQLGVPMTRAELMTRIDELQAQIAAFQPDPLRSDSDNATRSSTLTRSLASYQERLKRLEAYR